MFEFQSPLLREREREKREILRKYFVWWGSYHASRVGVRKRERERERELGVRRETQTDRGGESEK